MKKLILVIIGILAFTLTSVGQNTFKYRIDAEGGIQIGDSVSGSNVQRLDSAIIRNDTLYIYSLGTRYIAGTITVGGGAGDVTKVGTPVDNQVTIWTGDGTVEGDPDFTFDGDNLTVDGKITGNNFEIGSAEISEAELEILDGATLSTAELNTLDGISTASDLGTQLDLKAPLANADLTGSTTASDLQTDLLTVGEEADAAEIADITEDGSYFYVYDNAGGELSGHVADALTEDAGDVLTLLADTVLLFGETHGYGNPGDTILFMDENVLWGQYMDGEHEYILTEARAVVHGSSPDVDINWYYDVNFRDATPSTVLTSDLAVTSTTIGDTSTVFTNDTIGVGNWLWLQVKDTTAKPTQLAWTLYGYKNDADAVTYNAEYQAVYDAMSVKPLGDTATWQNDLVYSIDTAGLWDRIEIMYVAATSDSVDALMNWISPGNYTLTAQGGSTFQRYEGLSGDVTNGYFATGWNPSSNGNYITQDSITLAIYLRGGEEGNNNAGGSTIGCYKSETKHRIAVTLTTNNQLSAWLNVGSANAIVTSNSDTTGFFIFTRTASDHQEWYLNGLTKDTETDASVGIPDDDLDIFRNITHTFYSGNQFSVFIVLDGISDDEASDLNTIVETYMDKIGSGVQESIWLMLLLLPMIFRNRWQFKVIVK